MRVPQRGGSRNRPFLPAFLPSLRQLSPGPLGMCHCHIAPVRARFCLVHVVYVPGYRRLMQCMRNLERTFLSVPTPPLPAACSTSQWAPGIPRPVHTFAFLEASYHILQVLRTQAVLCSPATPWRSNLESSGSRPGTTVVPDLLLSTGPRQPNRERPVLAGLDSGFWTSCAASGLCCWRLHFVPATPRFAPSGTSCPPYQDWSIR